MTLSVTRDELTAMQPCGLEERLKLFGRRESLNTKQALAAGVSISDVLWVAGKLGHKRECVLFALRCAQRVAHLNTDPRVQAALDATQAWLDNPTDETAGVAGAAGAAAWAAEAAVDAWAAARDAAWAAQLAKFIEMFG